METLLITSPKNNATVTTSSITVTGRVSGGAGQVAVNDVPVSTDKQTGQFSSIVELQQGENKIKITGKSGRRDILKYVTVFYQPA